MRCETNHGRGLLIFKQIGHKAFERDLPLRERTLIECCKNLPGLDQRNELLEEIGCDHLNLSEQSLFFNSLEYGNTIRRADIQTLWLCFAAEQSQRLSISFLWTFMRLDCWQQGEVRRKHRKGSCEATKFLRMIDGGKFASHGRDVSFATQFVRQKLRCQRAACISMRRDQANATTTGRIAGDAEHCSATVGQASDDRIKLSRVSRGKDDAVVPLFQSGLQHLRISLPKAGILVEDYIDMHADGGICRSSNAGAQRVKEMRDLFRENNSYLDSAVQLQRLRGEIGSISQSLCRLPHTFFRLGADAGTLVQRTIHRTDRDAKFSRDVFDARSLGRIFHKIRRSSKNRKTMLRRLRIKRTISTFCSYAEPIEAFVASQILRTRQRREDLMSPTRREFLRGSLALAALPSKANFALAEDTASTNVLWYGGEAKRWLEALPIGNGSAVGGMVFGGLQKERIALTESTVWSGAPSTST